MNLDNYTHEFVLYDKTIEHDTFLSFTNKNDRQNVTSQRVPRRRQDEMSYPDLNIRATRTYHIIARTETGDQNQMENNLATLETKNNSIVTIRRPQYHQNRHCEIHLRSKYQCNLPNISTLHNETFHLYIGNY